MNEDRFKEIEEIRHKYFTAKDEYYKFKISMNPWRNEIIKEPQGQISEITLKISDGKDIQKRNILLSPDIVMFLYEERLKVLWKEFKEAEHQYKIL